nr:hypothetical protein [Saprospiraceae bacterium]
MADPAKRDSTGLVLNATNRSATPPNGVAKDGTCLTYEEDCRMDTVYCTTPIGTIVTDRQKRTIPLKAVARHGQF